MWRACKFFATKRHHPVVRKQVSALGSFRNPNNASFFPSHHRMYSAVQNPFVKKLKGHKDSGSWDKALQVLEEMDEAGAEIDAHIYLLAMQACQKQQQHDVILGLYDTMLQDNVLPEGDMMDLMLQTFVESENESRTADLVQQLFSSPVEVEPEWYSRALEACIEASDIEAAVSILTQGLESESSSLDIGEGAIAAVLELVGSGNDTTDLVTEVLSSVMNHTSFDIKTSREIASAAINAYVYQNALRHASQLFSTLDHASMQLHQRTYKQLCQAAYNSYKPTLFRQAYKCSMMHNVRLGARVAFNAVSIFHLTAHSEAAEEIWNRDIIGRFEKLTERDCVIALSDLSKTHQTAPHFLSLLDMMMEVNHYRPKTYHIASAIRVLLDPRKQKMLNEDETANINRALEWYEFAKSQGVQNFATTRSLLVGLGLMSHSVPRAFIEEVHYDLASLSSENAASGLEDEDHFRFLRAYAAGGYVDSVMNYMENHDIELSSDSVRSLILGYVANGGNFHREIMDIVNTVYRDSEELKFSSDAIAAIVESCLRHQDLTSMWKLFKKVESGEIAVNDSFKLYDRLLVICTQHGKRKVLEEWKRVLNPVPIPKRAATVLEQLSEYPNHISTREVIDMLDSFNPHSKANKENNNTKTSHAPGPEIVTRAYGHAMEVSLKLNRPQSAAKYWYNFQSEYRYGSDLKCTKLFLKGSILCGKERTAVKSADILIRSNHLILDATILDYVFRIYSKMHLDEKLLDIWEKRETLLVGLPKARSYAIAMESAARLGKKEVAVEALESAIEDGKEAELIALEESLPRLSQVCEMLGIEHRVFNTSQKPKQSPQRVEKPDLSVVPVTLAPVEVVPVTRPPPSSFLQSDTWINMIDSGEGGSVASEFISACKDSSMSSRPNFSTVTQLLPRFVAKQDYMNAHRVLSACRDANIVTLSTKTVNEILEICSKSYQHEFLADVLASTSFIFEQSQYADGINTCAAAGAHAQVVSIYKSMLQFYERQDASVVVNVLRSSKELGDDTVFQEVLSRIANSAIEEEVVESLFSKPSFSSLQVLVSIQKQRTHRLNVNPNLYSAFVETVKTTTPPEKLKSLKMEHFQVAESK